MKMLYMKKTRILLLHLLLLLGKKANFFSNNKNREGKHLRLTIVTHFYRVIVTRNPELMAIKIKYYKIILIVGAIVIVIARKC